MQLMGVNPCGKCKHTKSAHRAGLGVCTVAQCRCKLYLSGEYVADVLDDGLMGGPAKPDKRDRTVTPSESKLRETVKVEIREPKQEVLPQWRDEPLKLRVSSDTVMQLGLNNSVDFVNHPPHYNQHPSGIECIAITEHMNFCIGNAIKYLWRADDKDDPIENLEKAKWYIEREIKRRKSASAITASN